MLCEAQRCGLALGTWMGECSCKWTLPENSGGRLSDLTDSNLVQRIILPFHSDSWKDFLVWFYLCVVSVKGEEKEKEREKVGDSGVRAAIQQ